MNTFAKTILVMLFLFFGITGIASANYQVVPVKQYAVSPGLTYSDWYNQFRTQLGAEHNGKLYGKEYQKHFALWLKVEGLTPAQVNRNANKILTVPVSGELEKKASFYSILSDEGQVPDSVVIAEKTFVRSAEAGAEKLYTVALTATTIPASSVALTVKAVVAQPVVNALHIPSAVALIKVASAPVTETAMSAEDREMYEIAILLAVVFALSVYSFVKRQDTAPATTVAPVTVTPVAQAPAVSSAPAPALAPAPAPAPAPAQATVATPTPATNERVFELKDDDLFNAVVASGKLNIQYGRTVFLAIDATGKIEIPGNVPVLNKDKNIRDGLRQAFLVTP